MDHASTTPSCLPPKGAPLSRRSCEVNWANHEDSQFFRPLAHRFLGLLALDSRCQLIGNGFQAFCILFGKWLSPTHIQGTNDLATCDLPLSKT